MIKNILLFLLGAVAGAAGLYGLLAWREARSRPLAKVAPEICYSCLWKPYDPKIRADLVAYYRQYQNSDPLVMADLGYVLWRTTETENCGARQAYRTVGAQDADPYRRYVANAVLGIGAPECGERGAKSFAAAAEAAKAAGLNSEAALLHALAEGKAQPRFGDVEIARKLEVPAGATAMVLGASKIEITDDTPVGVQVDRVTRDWISAQLKWAPSSAVLPAPLIPYHEGRFVSDIQGGTAIRLYPLSGALVARRGDKWFGADETGTFRFQILEDKMMYPTTHIGGGFGIIEDTHGISALASLALERHVKVVIGCGDSEGKAKAAFYLAQKGVDVVFPGDRYQDMLLGYEGAGTLLGGVPVRAAAGKSVLGDQPVRFLLREPIVVEDTKTSGSTQYYDAPARYFRRLSEATPLKLEYVLVDATDQIDRVLAEARRTKAQAVAVRVATAGEDKALRAWLQASPRNRAILFHSALYPYAQPLFQDFRAQVTFGDLRPAFE